MEELSFKLDKGEDKHVKYLFERAFSIEERPPYRFLRTFQNNEMYGIYEGDRFIGLVDLAFYKDIIYLFFLAITPKLRQKGYGSKVLNWVKDNSKGKRLYLLMEEVKAGYSNYEERVLRQKFYIKNGLFPIGVKLEEFQVIYEMMGNDKSITYQDHLDLTEVVIRDYFPIYLKNIHQIKE